MLTRLKDFIIGPHFPPANCRETGLTRSALWRPRLAVEGALIYRRNQNGLERIIIDGPCHLRK